MFVKHDLHIIELNLYAIQQRIVIRRPRRDFIQRVNHLDDAIQNPLWQHQTQIARRSRERRHNHALFQPLFGASASAFQIPKALHDDPAAQHIGKSGNALAITVAVLEGF